MKIRPLPAVSVQEIGKSDRPISGDLKVPGAAVSILTEALVAGGVPALGFWVQVPHYVRSPYHRGVLALLEKAGDRLGIAVDVDEIRRAADTQQAELDRFYQGALVEPVNEADLGPITVDVETSASSNFGSFASCAVSSCRSRNSRRSSSLSVIARTGPPRSS